MAESAGREPVKKLLGRVQEGGADCLGWGRGLEGEGRHGSKACIQVATDRTWFLILTREWENGRSCGHLQIQTQETRFMEGAGEWNIFGFECVGCKRPIKQPNGRIPRHRLWGWNQN